ncbi:phosphodiester glycosidase family protein [Thalassococcus lentus]|uniref:Phosphodiester glycosidase family protein n=1 Tax=Thalassococcus lentus TaxID=1210524 RepID=A0ABT4XXB7_9RHOB|nr:phosphodiester glycosidase family protein [Thalassococcus lentus]MDA7426448.1 phosphodiester glycosidase family protein [Thalassococcus lentus]
MRCAAISLALCGVLWLSPQAAKAVECETLEHSGNSYAVCEVNPATEELRLFRADPTGIVYGHFSELETMLGAFDKKLAFAMNAGMYHPDRAPVGHYVEDGAEQMRVIPNAGPGNFGLLPNGIFCIRDRRADVIETRDYLASRPDCTHATQSGPMLVIDGALHPRFLPDSTSRHIRNAVGTSIDGRRAVFAISDNAVTFYEFAKFFRDVLKLPNALFLDGNVSRLFAPRLGRDDRGRQMGPIVAVVEPES